MTEFILTHGWPLLLAVSFKSLFVVALAGIAAVLLHRASAAARHLAWRLGVVGLLLLPALSVLLPGWAVPLPVRPPAPSALVSTPPIAAPAVPPASPVVSRPVVPAAGSASEAAPAAGASAPPRPMPPWQVWAFGGWAVGGVLVLLPTLLGLVAVLNLERRCRPITGGPPLDALAALTPRPVCLMTAPESGPAVPMTWGGRRPALLLPPGADAWPGDRLRATLLHELAHIERADWAAQMAAQVACALYWFNPLVWLAARRMAQEAERACDDRVLGAGVVPADYAGHLLDTVRGLQDKPYPAALPMAQASGLEGRLRAVLQKNRRREMLTRRVLIVAALAAGGVVTPLAMMRPVAKAEVSSAAHHRIYNTHIYHLAPPDSPATAIAKLKRLYLLIEIYRRRHGGDFPATRPNGLVVDMSNHPRAYGLPDQGAGNIWQAAQFFGNRMTTDTGDPAYDISYFMNGKRPNGAPVGSPKPVGARDVYAYTDQQSGFYLVLWDNGQVEKVPASEALSVPMYDPIAYGTSAAAGTDNRQIAFRGQAGLPPRALIRPLVSSRAPARSKYVAYNFTWGKIPGNPDKAIAQLKQIYQWGQVYRTRHGGAYPASSADFDLDLSENPQVYGLSDSPDGTGALQALQNPDVRFAERTSHDPSLIPYMMFAPRFDGQPLGGPKPPGTRDVLATTDIYEHTNWSHGIPSGHVGFWLVLWDDGTVERVPGARILYVPRGVLTGKTVTPAAVRAAMTHDGAEVTFGFPGQAGLPANTLTRDQMQAAGLGVPSF